MRTTDVIFARLSENIVIPAGANKEEAYTSLLPQIEALIAGESDVVAVLASVAAALHQAFGQLWTGFYLVKSDELVLGPFQGPVACMRIAHGKGVCGRAWQSGSTQVVPDVDAFPGHIACSSLSRSEIVVPLLNRQQEVVAVLDIDSIYLNTFDNIDRLYLEILCIKIADQVF